MPTDWYTFFLCAYSILYKCYQHPSSTSMDNLIRRETKQNIKNLNNKNNVVYINSRVVTCFFSCSPTIPFMKNQQKANKKEESKKNLTNQSWNINSITNLNIKKIIVIYVLLNHFLYLVQPLLALTIEYAL